MSWLSKALHGNVVQAILDPAGSTVRALTNKGDTSTNTLGDFLDPAGLGAGKFTDAAIGGGQLQGKLNTSDKGGSGAPAAPPPSPSTFNPFASLTWMPGVGYVTGSNGTNPFVGVAQSIPQQFFRSPQAFQALLSILNQRAPANPGVAAPGAPITDTYNVPPSTYGIPGSVPTDSTPGPDPAGTTMYNSSGGFGNGGGSMTMGQRKFAGSPWVRAL